MEKKNLDTGRDSLNCASQLPDIPKETYEYEEITVSEIYKLLNGSKLLSHKSDQRMMLDVVDFVEKEQTWKMKDCELNVFLPNMDGLVNDRVKQIVIKAGKCNNKANCTKNTNGVTICKWQKDYPGQDIPTENYHCKIVASSVINKILNKSEFLELLQHRSFLANEVRSEVTNEHEAVLRNCIITIQLDNIAEGAKVCTKHIIIEAGECENKILSSEKNPWIFEKRTIRVAIGHGLHDVWEGISSTIPKFVGQVILNLARQKIM